MVLLQVENGIRSQVLSPSERSLVRVRRYLCLVFSLPYVAKTVSFPADFQQQAAAGLGDTVANVITKGWPADTTAATVCSAYPPVFVRPAGAHANGSGDSDGSDSDGSDSNSAEDANTDEEAGEVEPRGRGETLWNFTWDRAPVRSSTPCDHTVVSSDCCPVFVA